MAALVFASLLALTSTFALQSSARLGTAGSGASTGSSAETSPLAELAASHPGKRVEVIVQLQPTADPASASELVSSAGGVIEHRLPIINGFSTSLRAAAAEGLASNSAVHAVSLNASIESEGRPDAIDASRLATAYNPSIRADRIWNADGDERATGRGVGVAVIDTGIDGDLPDFRVSGTDATSRVVASAVINPAATQAGDSYGHGTHVAGLIAGNGLNRPAGDPLRGKYIGVAPEANLIDVKIADEQGRASVMDVIDGLQFAVDHQAEFNIRVANLSLKSTVAESYKTDPLDAAVEAAWNSGIVVVTAAGNDGPADDAVSYAPGNDPYVISVGAVDDMGTAKTDDDALESWSSRGTTQDGFAKPDVVAPGSHMVSTVPPNAEFTRLCPACLTGGGYFRVGGSSMAAGVVSGEVALLLQVQPGLAPSQVKAQLTKHTRAIDSAKRAVPMLVDASGKPVAPDKGQFEKVRSAEIDVEKTVKENGNRATKLTLTPNILLDPATGLIDYARASWSRASWSTAAEGLRASWSRASWSRASWSRASWSATPESCMDLERASWSRASWSRASWSRASWSRASWSADGMSTPDLPAQDIALIDAEIAAAKDSCSQLLAQIDPARASWSRASWSRASWSTSFGK